MAFKENLVIDQGATFTHDIALKYANNDARDLSGYTGSGKIKKWYSYSNAEVDFTVSIPTPTNGIVSISLTAVQTDALDFGRFVYDVEIDSSGTVERIREGLATVSPSVTK